MTWTSKETSKWWKLTFSRGQTGHRRGKIVASHWWQAPREKYSRGRDGGVCSGGFCFRKGGQWGLVFLRTWYLNKGQTWGIEPHRYLDWLTYWCSRGSFNNALVCQALLSTKGAREGWPGAWEPPSPPALHTKATAWYHVLLMGYPGSPQQGCSRNLWSEPWEASVSVQSYRGLPGQGNMSSELWGHFSQTHRSQLLNSQLDSLPIMQVN